MEVTGKECHENNVYFYSRGYKHGERMGFKEGIAVSLIIYGLSHLAVSLYNKYNPSLQNPPAAMQTQTEQQLQPTHTPQLNKSLLKKFE